MKDNSPGLSGPTESATLAGGCFWCLEAVFLELAGVEQVVSGYSGGAIENPTYREVSAGTTGHAEAVQILFNPEKISYRNLLEVFFTIHDPTTLDRQGADVGPQYRSAIFYHSDAQKHAAEEVIQKLSSSNTWENPIVTEITPFHNFYPAENYHKDYYKQHGEEPYCRLVIQPKIAKLRKHFMDKLKRQ
ncbi:MAG: peptide-methionine (S)-S-oxide reductase [Nitrospiraceae bacterium]|nr:MAG: peptide-methionine (S)-S-oxide reductase [Nitrospiraceae bacterium]